MKLGGLFITFEGGEGAGKTTQIKTLKEWLEIKGHTVCLTREPGGTPEAEKIRNLLVQRDGGNWTPEAEVLLLYAARHMHVEHVIKPALARGEIVICDRFADSTRAYQSYGHGLPLNFVEKIHKQTLNDFEPNITFLLDIPAEKGLERSRSHMTSDKAQKSEQTEDRFENLDMSFHKRLRDGFLEMARTNPQRFIIIDALQTPDDIKNKIQDKLTRRLMVDLFGDPIVEKKPESKTQQKELKAVIVDTPQHYNAPSDGEITPANNRNLIGHNNLVMQLETAFKESKFPHAILLTGPKGIGKATLAYRIARYLLCTPEHREKNLKIAENSITNRQVETGGHPDLFIAQPQFDEKKGMRKSSLDVKTVRRIAPFMRLRSSFDNGWRVVIVDEAHTMTQSAQNGLLKILEEPPKNAVLIVVSTTMGSLLPTIKSRVQHFPMSPLSPENMKAVTDVVLSEHGPIHDDDLELLSHLAEGSPGRVIELLEYNGLKVCLEMLSIFDKFPNFGAEDTKKFIAGLSRPSKLNTHPFELFTNHFLWFLKAILYAKAIGKFSSLPKMVEQNTLTRHIVTGDFPSQKIISLYDEANDLLKRTQYQYLDKENALLQIFNKIKGLV